MKHFRGPRQQPHIQLPVKLQVVYQGWADAFQFRPILLLRPNRLHLNKASGCPWVWGSLLLERGFRGGPRGQFVRFTLRLRLHSYVTRILGVLTCTLLVHHDRRVGYCLHEAAWFHLELGRAYLHNLNLTLKMAQATGKFHIASSANVDLHRQSTAKANTQSGWRPILQSSYGRGKLHLMSFRHHAGAPENYSFSTGSCLPRWPSPKKKLCLWGGSLQQA